MHKYFNSNPKCPMCYLEENMEHVFSCDSATAKKTRHETLKSIKRILSKNNQDLAQWWCTMINSCFEALGALLIEEFLPAEQYLQFRQAQADLRPMTFYKAESTSKSVQRLTIEAMHPIKTTSNPTPVENSHHLVHLQPSTTQNHKNRAHLQI